MATKLKDKRTYIILVLDQYLSFAMLPTSLGSNDPLPLKHQKEDGRPTPLSPPPCLICASSPFPNTVTPKNVSYIDF